MGTIIKVTILILLLPLMVWASPPMLTDIQYLDSVYRDTLRCPCIQIVIDTLREDSTAEAQLFIYLRRVVVMNERRTIETVSYILPPDTVAAHKLQETKRGDCWHGN